MRAHTSSSARAVSSMTASVSGGPYGVISPASAGHGSRPRQHRASRGDHAWSFTNGRGFYNLAAFSPYLIQSRLELLFSRSLVRSVYVYVIDWMASAKHARDRNPIRAAASPPVLHPVCSTSPLRRTEIIRLPRSTVSLPEVGRGVRSASGPRLLSRPRFRLSR